MFEAFTDRARRVLVMAQQEAVAMGHFVGSDHVVVALALEGDGVAGRVLGRHGLSPEALRQQLTKRRPPRPTVDVASALTALGVDAEKMRAQAERSFGAGALRVPAAEKPAFTEDAKRLLERALEEAVVHGHDYIGTEHLLLAALGGEADESDALALLAATEADVATLRQDVERLLARFREIHADPTARAARSAHDRLQRAVLRLSVGERRRRAYELLDATAGRTLAAATEAALDLPVAEIAAAYAAVPAAVDAARDRIDDELRLGPFLDAAPALEEHPTVVAADALRASVHRLVRPGGPIAAGDLATRLSTAIAAAFDRIADGTDATTALAGLDAELTPLREEAERLGA